LYDVIITFYTYVAYILKRNQRFFFFKLDNVELKDGLIPCAVLGCKTQAACFSARTGCNWVQDLKEFGLEVRRGKDRQKEL
jgi:hypothetical protein